MLVACVTLVFIAWVAFKLPFLACVASSFLFCSLCRIRVSFTRVPLFSQFSWHVSPPSLFSWHMSSVSSPSCCSWRGSPSKFNFITFMACFDNQNKTIKEFIYASLLLGVCRLQSILVLWHLSHLRRFLLPYIEPQVSCQQSESPLGLIFMEQRINYGGLSNTPAL